MAQFTLPTKATVDRPRAKGYDGFIGDLYFRLAASPQQPATDETAPPQPDRFTTEVNPEDFGESFGKTFSKVDFTGGAGLDQAHQRDATERDLTRYWDSRNVDIRRVEGSVQEIRLLRATAAVGSTGTDTFPSLAQIGGRLFWINGNDVLNTADPTVGSPTINNEDPHAAEGDQAVLDLAVLGDELYAAITTNGIHNRSSGGTWAHWSDLAATRLWGVKARVLASTGAALYEAAAAAGSTLLHTLPSGQTWEDICDAGAAILAAGSDGYIYAFAEESGQLVLKAQTRVEGEKPRSIIAAQGFVFYSTIQSVAAGGKIARWWRAVLSDAFVLEAGQVLRQWGSGAETVDHDPSKMLVTRDHVYVGVVEDGSETHLWRYDFVTTAVSRDLIFGVSARPGGIAVDNERLFVTLASGGLHREATTYATSGWLMTPLADFFTARNKQWIGGRLWVRQITSNEAARLYYATDPEVLEDAASGAWVELIELASGVGGDEVAIANTEARWLAGKIELLASVDAATSPRVRGCAFRAFPGFNDVILQLPINVSDQVERPNRRRVRLNGHGEQIWAALKEMEGKPKAVELFRPPTRVRGIVESVSVPIRTRTERGSVTIAAMVTVRGLRENPLSAAAGVASLGSVVLGVTSLGGVE